MNRHALKIELAVRGPFLTKSSSPSSFGLDAAAFRISHGANRGAPAIPERLLKGKLLESLQQLGYSDAERQRLLGQDTAPDSGNDPRRGHLILSDLAAEGKSESRSIHRIAIEHEMGSVKEKALQVIEAPFGVGEEALFFGWAWCYGSRLEEIRAMVEAGLKWIGQIGANRTVGFGQVLDASVTLHEEPELTMAAIPARPEAVTFALQPRGPLCVARPKIGGNLYESEEFIPGNMIAGAMVETWTALCGLGAGSRLEDCAAADPAHAILAKHFDALRFRHAFPGRPQEVRPRALPLSTARAGDSVWDLAHCRIPSLVRAGGGLVAPEFSIDWKSDAAERTRLGWISPARELRVRTKIDSINRRADRGLGEDLGDGGKLFAWEMIHPWAAVEGEAAAIEWKGQIDLGDIPVSDRAPVAEALGWLLGRLGFVSKTKAVCNARIVFTDRREAPQLENGETVAVCLQTPMLLADPRFQDVAGVRKSGALSSSEMHLLYAAAWRQLSSQKDGPDEPCLELSHYFAEQLLVGGNHLANRFQRGKPYDPWLLTNAGSVFVFDVRDAVRASALLADWLSMGVPLPKWASKYATWKNNPYLPQNGFGEIALHHGSAFPAAETVPIEIIHPAQ